MNKLFATIVLAALALSGCIKEDDSYKELLPLQPGMNIYNMTMTQNAVAMQPANAGIRLALLLAEAAKQYPETELKDVDLTKLKIEGNSNSVISLLFTAGAKIERQDDGSYEITYNEDYQQPDGFYLKGSVLVRTNGAEQLKDAQVDKVWQVEIQDDLKVLSRSNYGTQTVHMEGGSTTLYSNGDGSYTIAVRGLSANIDQSTVHSNWSADFTLSGANADLVYSECRGKDFKISEGRAEGSSIYVGTDSSNLRMSYYLSSGSVYRSGQIIEGTQECSFESFNYDTAAYPSPDVRYVWSNDGNQLYQKIYYNGYVYPKN